MQVPGFPDTCIGVSLGSLIALCVIRQVQWVTPLINEVYMRTLCVIQETVLRSCPMVCHALLDLLPLNGLTYSTFNSKGTIIASETEEEIFRILGKLLKYQQ